MTANSFLDIYNAEIVKHSINCISFVQAHAEDVKKTHLRDLLSDDERLRSMVVYDTYFTKLYQLYDLLFSFIAITRELGDYYFRI